MIDLAPDVVTVVITRADGGLTVKRIIQKEYRLPTEREAEAGITGRVLMLQRDVTPAFIEAEIAKRAALNGYLEWHVVPNDYCDETTDRTYRNAWKHVPGKRKPEHDMPKAREIQRVFLRKQRLAEFCRLDNDYRIADEAGDVKAKRDIGAQRQKFRDVTTDPRIEAAQTVLELKALTLKALLPNETTGEVYMDKMRISPAIKEKQNG